MASSEPDKQVHPLRISKTLPSGSPTKIPRPLSEISPAEKRRNSPSWNQVNKKMSLNTDSSPFQSSPLDSTTSPRLFWQNRSNYSSENSFYGRGGSPSPTRRSSIERLQKASRVKNSNILALEHKQEYDPTKVPVIERPLAKPMQGNAFGGSGLSPLRSSAEGKGHQRSESKTNIPMYSPTKSDPFVVPPTLARGLLPSRDQASPTKSSLAMSRFKSSYDRENDVYSPDESIDERELPDGKTLHRHAKSVTFDAAPPQVNEYEMVTPDISSIGSGSREGSYDYDEDFEDDDIYHPEEGLVDDSFDASLEDTDKTPVVGPDDWRHDTPGSDRFESSPRPDGTPGCAIPGRPAHGRTDSASSNTDHRPLPPLPGMGYMRSHSNSSNGLSTTAERLSGSHRTLPSPPAAASSKADIQNIGHGKMSLEERLKLMMLSDGGKTAAELQRERRMRRAGPRDRVESQTPEPESHNASVLEAAEAEDTLADISGLDDYQLPPRISRESIMRRVNGNRALDRESNYNFSSPAPSLSPERQTPYDPDVPIPSTEDSIVEDDDISSDEGSVIVKREPDEEKMDVCDIPDMYYEDDDRMDEGRPESIQESLQYADSVCSDEIEAQKKDDVSDMEDGPVTPRVTSPNREGSSFDTVTNFGESVPQPKNNETQYIELSREHEAYHPPEEENDDQFLDGLEPPKMAAAHEYLQRPYTPEGMPLSKPEYDGSGWGDDEFDEPGTPDSVIHHPMSDEEDIEEEAPVAEAPAIPERQATIKAPGSKLKTRVSATPSDLMAMREQRRQVSYEVPVPPIPSRHRSRLSRDMELDQEQGHAHDDYIDRHPSFKKRSLTLELDLGLSLDQDFDRVIENQKVEFQKLYQQKALQAARGSPSRPVSGLGVEWPQEDRDANNSSRKQRGYLMRQNTKVITASDKDTDDFRGARSAGNSPVKQSRPQSWTVEPWNPAVRRRSTTRKRPVATGPAPPLPGQESNAQALTSVGEEEMAVDPAIDDAGERGRLFVKVLGVKELDLPIPRTERTWFSLTLDNGVHCVTTAWLEMARNAPIGQEFELVVPNDLEFQLTLNVKLEKPQPKKVTASPTKINKPKSSAFSRVFGSPKKRKEKELRAREEEERLAQQQREAQARAMNAHPTAWDLLSPLAAEDGSFARAYVCLKEHENRCFGRPYVAEVACFNEWATEEAAFASSVKSKRGNTAVVRKAPYKIGKLELQLLFIPRPKDASDDDMPKSMNGCIREMKAAEERLSRNWEGPLSQQGGDCPFWRRRYFKLVGTKLTAYHEATRQPRATINLANAKRLIDDRRQLTEKEITGKGGKRRRSGFAEEEEGYMFVEEGFRIRFNNGEMIDFYADTAQDKEGWMKVLSEVFGRDANDDDDGITSRRKWCELVIKREEALRKRAEGRRVHSRTKSMYV
ncbi:putative gtp binding protein [Zalerion maritima]|uniref:Gtp binding protein n=1 Tax=Zalerion maritima TaxID=339359 RepID=A0AAD5RPB2_9PEZI|nr:putative gtp binding protein [Zalerion maritima]